MPRSTPQAYVQRSRPMIRRALLAAAATALAALAAGGPAAAGSATDSAHSRNADSATAGAARAGKRGAVRRHAVRRRKAARRCAAGRRKNQAAEKGGRCHRRAPRRGAGVPVGSAAPAPPSPAPQEPSDPLDALPPPVPVVPGVGSYLSVRAREFSYTLSRPVVTAGRVTFELRNAGEDPHNLVVSPENSHEPLASFGQVGPGSVAARGVDLAQGRYYLWCSLDGHEAIGMKASLRVE